MGLSAAVDAEGLSRAIDAAGLSTLMDAPGVDSDNVAGGEAAGLHAATTARTAKRARALSMWIPLCRASGPNGRGPRRWVSLCRVNDTDRTARGPRTNPGLPLQPSVIPTGRGETSPTGFGPAAIAVSRPDAQTLSRRRSRSATLLTTRGTPFSAVLQETTLLRPTLARAGLRSPLPDTRVETDSSMRLLEAAISVLALAAAVLLGLAH